jgi:carotenoid cleavage dioxygenase-like enzyme
VQIGAGAQPVKILPARSSTSQKSTIDANPTFVFHSLSDFISRGKIVRELMFRDQTVSRDSVWERLVESRTVRNCVDSPPEQSREQPEMGSGEKYLQSQFKRIRVGSSFAALSFQDFQILCITFLRC